MEDPSTQQGPETDKRKIMNSSFFGLDFLVPRLISLSFWTYAGFILHGYFPKNQGCVGMQVSSYGSLFINGAREINL